MVGRSGGTDAGEHRGGFVSERSLSGYRIPPASSAQVREVMRGNRARDTKPELRIRQALHRRGWRYRVHYSISDIRIRPDIVFTRRRVAVFIDGCFWHGCPEHGNVPDTHRGYWSAKLRRNVERDVENTRTLQSLGWRVVRVWEHTSTDRAIELIEEACRANGHR